MNATELKKNYLESLRERLKEVDNERDFILGELSQLTGESAVEVNGADVTRAIMRDRPRRKAVWTRQRREEQSRRMKRLHREGRFAR